MGGTAATGGKGGTRVIRGGAGIAVAGGGRAMSSPLSVKHITSASGRDMRREPALRVFDFCDGLGNLGGVSVSELKTIICLSLPTLLRLVESEESVSSMTSSSKNDLTHGRALPEAK